MWTKEQIQIIDAINRAKEKMKQMDRTSVSQDYEDIIDRTALAIRDELMPE